MVDRVKAIEEWISIHALREESDFRPLEPTPGIEISIHALREESDRIAREHIGLSSYFNPRSP